MRFKGELWEGVPGYLNFENPGLWKILTMTVKMFFFFPTEDWIQSILLKC